uniref:Uncharacterized protein n=1 Tax=Romanomermis culicivorax TaxID=13658 RepID=A0A915L3J7_ROMCU
MTQSGLGHLCFMQPVGIQQIEEDVFETTDEGVNDDNTCLKVPINLKLFHFLKMKVLLAVVQRTPNFQGYTLVGLDTELIMAGHMKHFKFTIPMPADSKASSYTCYVQLAFASGTMFILKPLPQF